MWVELICGEHTSIVPGLLAVGRAALAETLGWSIEDFDRVWMEIAARGMAFADWAARLIWLPRAVHHNQPESPSVVKGWAAAWVEFPECDLLDRALAGTIAELESEGRDDSFLAPLRLLRRQPGAQPPAQAGLQPDGQADPQPEAQADRQPDPQAERQAGAHQEQEQEQLTDPPPAPAADNPLAPELDRPITAEEVRSSFVEHVVPLGAPTPPEKLPPSVVALLTRASAGKELGRPLTRAVVAEAFRRIAAESPRLVKEGTRGLDWFLGPKDAPGQRLRLALDGQLKDRPRTEGGGGGPRPPPKRKRTQEEIEKLERQARERRQAGGEHG